MSAIWINEDWRQNWSVGDIAFLRESSPQRGASTYRLDLHPPRTNMSHEPRYKGWCGTTNNTGLYGLGLHRVCRVAKNGRMQVAPVTGDAETEALADLGYPDLS